jgi:excinuclease ABC subunit B
VKSTEAILGTTSVIERAAEESTLGGEAAKAPVRPYTDPDKSDNTAVSEPVEHLQAKGPDPKLLAMTKEQLRKEIRDRQRKMQLAAKELDFMAAAAFRDEIKEMQTLLETAR